MSGARPSRTPAAEHAAAGRFGNRPWLDRAFTIGITIKGIDGALDALAGLLLLLVPPADITRLVLHLTHNKLSRDPDDVVANFLRHGAEQLVGSAHIFASAYLIVHGLIKVGLVLALLKQKWSAYPWMIGVLSVFICYQVYQVGLRHSLALAILTLIDAVIAVLVYLEYRKHKRAAAA